jgi:hypothetical protein
VKQISGSIFSTVVNEVPSVSTGYFEIEIPSPFRDYSIKFVNFLDAKIFEEVIW